MYLERWVADFDMSMSMMKEAGLDVRSVSSDETE